MEFGVKKSCPNCSQYFSLPDQSKQSKGNHLPLLLHCGHPICFNCLNNIIKFKEPIECKVCRTQTELSPTDLEIMLKKPRFILSSFPIDKYIIGQLYLNMVDATESASETQIDGEYFIDLKTLLASLKQNFGECVECQAKTTHMCKNCSSILCHECFKKIHSAFQTFKHHTYKNIESDIDKNYCPIHKEKPIEYYCKECDNKAMCMDCVMVGRGEHCKDHALTSAQEMHCEIAKELKTISPKVDETLRRLSSTALDVGYLLKSFDNTNASKCEVQKIINNVLNHFSKLHGMVQKCETETLDKLIKLKSQHKMSVYKAKEDITTNIKKLQAVINQISAVSSNTNLAQINVASVLDAAKKAADIPWYLSKGNDDASDPVISVKEELCSEIAQYVSIEGGASASYQLLRTGDVTGDIKPPPMNILYPPELLKDIRETTKAKPAPVQPQTPQPVPIAAVPKFRPRFGSNLSINSTGSTSSNKKVVQSVEPFNNKRNNQQKVLQEGTQDLIFISHIVDPHNFYVQRVCEQELVKEAIREYGKASSYTKPYSNNIQKGMLFVAYCESEKKWHRAKILNLIENESNPTIYEVLYIDFGSSDYVTINELRVIPPGRAARKGLALHCRMANLRPVDNWTADDSVLMHKIVNNKQAIIHVRHVHQREDEITYECDLTTFEEGVNLAKAFVFYDRGQLINPNLNYPPLSTVEERPKIFYSYNDYNNKKTVYDVIFTNIESPDKFYVRKLVLHDTYMKLSEDLERSYHLKHQKGIIHCPEEGMMCVVNVDEDTSVSGGGWRRAVVLSAASSLTRLQLLDTGETMIAHVSSVRRIQERHTALDALAVECHLHGVTPLNKKWSGGSLNLLQCFRSSRISMRVETCGRAVLGVLLFAETAEGDMLCVNHEMVHKRYAITTGMCNFKISSEEQVYTKTIPQIDKPKSNPKKQREKAITILRKSVPQSLAKKEIKAGQADTSLDAKDKGPIKLEVKVLHCESPSLLYVALVDQEKNMKELYADLQEYFCETKSGPKQDWKVGDKCCAVCKESKTWRRAKILEVCNEHAELFFSDFAVTEKVPLDALREIPKCFTTIRDASIKCHLSEILPGAGDNWPYLTIEHLKDKLDSYRRFFITKKGTMKADSLPIELWVYHITQGDALEPNKAEWRCLNQDIIDNGLGIPDRSKDKPRSFEDDSLAFLDLPGTIDDYLKPEESLAQMMEEIKLNYKPANLTAVSGTEKKPDTEKNIDIKNNPNTSDKYDIENKSDSEEKTDIEIMESTLEKPKEIYRDPKDWLPADNFSSTQFYGIVTHVNEAFILFVQEDVRRDKLQLLRSLMLRNQNTAPATPAAGDLCLSRFFADQQLYRGKIRSNDPERRILRVNYIDYGNTETCRYEDVLPVDPTSALRKLPAQTRRCALAHVAPPDGNSWTTEMLQYVHQIIVDKKCFFRVVGDKTADVVPVEIKLEDKFWLHEHLVEFDLAVRVQDWKQRIANMPIEIFDAETKFDPNPDYIIVDEQSEKSSVDLNKNWVDLMDEENDLNDHDRSDEFYPEREIDDTFWCTISAINSFDTLNLIVEETNEEIQALYRQLTEELQTLAPSQPVLENAFEHQACVAPFPADDRWYRARVLESCDQEKLLKLQYVDFGDREVIPESETRRVIPNWLTLPPAVIRAQLSNVICSPNADKETLVAAFADTFLDKRFIVKVIDREVDPIVVELRSTEEGELAYQNLIDQELFIESTSK